MASNTKQQTILVDGQKVTIKSRARSNVGNFCGFHVWINGVQRHVNKLHREEAEELALSWWKAEQVLKGLI